ncbi:MAG: hypothetical protein L6Q95_05175 [Planctomycetes bacterium]|nr:hypothetical protein [Planctomycetota bacterium]
MRRAAPWIALVVLAAGAAYLLVPEEPPPSPPLRPPPAVPSPAPEAKVRYFYRLLGSGQTIAVAAPLPGGSPMEISVWREIGGAALLGLGEPAFAFLTAPERYPEYVAAPDVLVAVLQLLAEAPHHPGTFPFLEHWLVEANCPVRVPGSDWPDEIRNLVFAAMKAHPVPEAAPSCVAEFDRPRRGHDLRAAAADILLRLGKADILNEAWRSLEPDLRAAILERLFQMAAPGAGDRNRAQVVALAPLLEEALASPRTVERFNAMGVLHRLGRHGMRDELIRFFEENRDADERAAYSALLLLAADGPDPFVLEACLRRVERPDAGAGFAGAVRILAILWPDRIAPRLFEWMRARQHVDPYMVLRQMLSHDRAAVVAWLRGEVRDGTEADLSRALPFIAREGVTELAPDLLAKVREAEPAKRTQLYAALVEMRAPGVEALLLAELASSIPEELRSAAATEILNLGAEAGLARLGGLLAEGDPAVLDALLRRAWKSRGAGIPAALVPGVLAALRGIPGEDGRRAALLVLRFRGRLEDVREGLVDAYRHEPSRRVAKEIGETIEELAHR